jgi:predicted transcriptional regulator with HTH domain
VIGALIGYRLRYRKQDSLVYLGLASCTTAMVDGKPVMMFSVSLQGLDIIDTLKEYRHRSNPPARSSLFETLRDKLWKKQ